MLVMTRNMVDLKDEILTNIRWNLTLWIPQDIEKCYKLDSYICYQVLDVKYFSVGPTSVAFIVPEIIFESPVTQWNTTEII